MTNNGVPTIMQLPDFYMNDLPEHLSQGDIFTRPDIENFFKYDPKENALIVLTYTCDFTNPNDIIPYVTFCPIRSIDILIEEYIRANLNKLDKDIEKSLIDKLNGLINNKRRFYFFIPPHEELDILGFADLTQIANISYEDSFKKILEKRITGLKNPWKEKLGWMIGYNYNRIALPDVDNKIISNYLRKNESVQKIRKKIEKSISNDENEQLV